MLVGELKTRIRMESELATNEPASMAAVEYPEERQRLIYRGQVLDDNFDLAHYKIGNDHTIHLVMRPVQSSVPVPAPAVVPASSAPASERATEEIGDTVSPSIPRIPRLENIRQGLLTLSTVFSTVGVPGEEADQSAAAASTTTTLHPSLYHIGQWVDVKDSVNQWLEATVIDVNPPARSLLVHYNGWPVRWDEWISWD